MPGALINPYDMPGMGAPSVSSEGEFMWGNRESYAIESGVIAAAAVDAGSSPTSLLRRALLMGIITASGKWTNYSATAVDGSQIVSGVLYESRNMLDYGSGVAADHQGEFVISGKIKGAQLLGLDNNARQQMRGRFQFDDDLCGQYTDEFRQELAKTANYTIVAADNGTLFTNTGAVGAVTFTLPAITNGLAFGFYGIADQTITIASAEGTNVATFNNVSASSIAFSTAGNKIGAMAKVFSNVAGTKWLTDRRCANTMTVA